MYTLPPQKYTTAQHFSQPVPQPCRNDFTRLSTLPLALLNFLTQTARGIAAFIARAHRSSYVTGVKLSVAAAEGRMADSFEAAEKTGAPSQA